MTFDSSVAEVYDELRGMTASEIDTWITLLSNLAQMPDDREVRILDLGCGTGRWSPVLASRLSAAVVGIDPSDEMLTVARARNQTPEVEYRIGRAENIPVDDAWADVVFMFLSAHHYESLDAAAREIFRVLRPGGLLFLRTEFSDRPHLFYWHGLLPEWGAKDRQLYPTTSEVFDHLSSAGIVQLRIARVPVLASESLSLYLERIGQKSLSALRDADASVLLSRVQELGLRGEELAAEVWEVCTVVHGRKSLSVSS